MYVFTNAFKNLWRSKGRNILYALIVFSIITVSVMGVLVRNSTGKLIDSYHQQFGSKVSLVPNMDNPSNQVRALSQDQLLQFGKSNLLQKADYKATISISPDKMTMLDEMEQVDNGAMGDSFSTDGTGKQTSGPVHNPKTNLIGSDSPQISEDFTAGKRKIVDGKIYAAGKQECLISQQLAKLNNLKVGDTVSLFGTDNTPAQSFTISGIFSDSTMVGRGAQQIKMPNTNRNNEILTSKQTALDSKLMKGSGTVEAQFYLKSPDRLKEFTKELRAKGLPTSYKVTTDAAAYKKVTAPVESLRQISTVFLVLVVGLGGVVLLLLSLISMRSRTYEIGVLRAIGMKKWKISTGLITESLAIVAVCLLVGLGVGFAATQPLAQSLLQGQQTSYAQQQKDAQSAGGGNQPIFIGGPGQETTADDAKPAKISAQMDGKSLGQIIGVSLAIVVLSSAAGVAYTTRLEPRKILAQGN